MNFPLPPAHPRSYLAICLGLTLSTLLSGCVAVENPAPQPAVNIPSATSIPLPTLIEEPSSTRTPTPRSHNPTASAGTCLDHPGRIVQEDLLDPALSRSQPFRIYLPPCYQPSNPEGYPTLYLLHGLYLNEGQWDELGVDELATDRILEGFLPPFLMVLPREQSGVDLEFAITQVLLPHIERTYQAIPDRDFRAIGGISRGGGWAFRIGWKHPGVFGAVGMHSPAVLPPDLFLFTRWLEDLSEDEYPDLWMDIGERDTLRFEVFAFREDLDRLGVPYTWSTDFGEHTTDYWSRQLEAYLRWYTEPWVTLDRAR